MKQEDWTQRLRQRLADHEESAPTDLWAGIEAQLSTPLPVRRQPLRRWLAAAAIIVLAIGGGYTLWHDDSPVLPQERAAAKQVGGKKLMASNAGAETVDAATATVEAVTVTVDAVTVNRQKSHTAVAPQPADTTDTAATAEEATPTVPTTPAATAATSTNAVRPQPTITRSREQQPQRHIRHQRGQVQVALYAANGFDSYDSHNGVLMSNEMAKTFYASRTFTPDPIYLAGYEERQHHRIPVSAGLSVSYQLTPRMALTTGVVYTRQRSDFTTFMRGSVVENQQTLHYIGVPIGLSYKLLAWHGLTLYAAANAQADWNLKATLQTSTHSQDIARDRMQLSAAAAAGVQYDLTPYIGLYAEPGLRHYFDNGSPVANYFKDHPTSFSLQLGLRLSLNSEPSNKQD